MNISVARGIVKLKNLRDGDLFVYNHVIALKTRYVNAFGQPVCYIVGDGGIFLGDADDWEVNALGELMVTPIILSRN